MFLLQNWLLTSPSAVPAPSPALPAPAQLLAGRREWGTGVPQLPLPRGSSAPAFALLLHQHRVFTVSGTIFRGRGRPRVGVPGSGGRRGSARLRSCGNPGSNRSHRLQSSERLRRLGGVSCGDRAVALTHRLKNTTRGNFRPRARLSLGSRAPAEAACGHGFGSPAGAGAGELHPRPLALSRFSASPPQTHPSLLPHIQRPERRE